MKFEFVMTEELKESMNMLKDFRIKDFVFGLICFAIMYVFVVSMIIFLG